MGAIGAIMAYGSPAQRRLAADLVLSGDKPAICITEPQAGSAATEMRTTATRHGDRWVIDGEKTWITGGGVSRLHLIFARAIEDGRARGIGGFIAVRNGAEDPAGLVVARRIPSMGLKGMPEAELRFAGLEIAARDPAMRATLGLDATSRVLLFGTEGATDPALYAELVGESAEDVMARAAA